MPLIEIQQASELATYHDSPLLVDFDPYMIQQHHADGHRFLVDGEGELRARCSIWWSNVPTMPGEHLGVIGHFAADDEASACELLASVSGELKKNDCTLAAGPMDGNTWRSYRFITESTDEPSFFLEPENPPQYPSYFVAAGFEPLASYRSAKCNDLTVQDIRIPAAIERLHKAGVSWRPISMDDFEEELKAIFHLSLKSFSQNYLYTAITEHDFLTQYRRIKPYINPDLVLMAEADGALMGYLFGIPDLAQAQRGRTVDTYIIKTVAVQSGRRYAGLGSVLVAESQRIASERGYRAAIHALMHEANNSNNISGHYAETIRRYTLFHKRLAAQR